MSILFGGLIVCYYPPTIYGSYYAYVFVSMCSTCPFYYIFHSTIVRFLPKPRKELLDKLLEKYGAGYHIVLSDYDVYYDEELTELGDLMRKAEMEKPHSTVFLYYLGRGQKIEQFFGSAVISFTINAVVFSFHTFLSLSIFSVILLIFSVLLAFALGIFVLAGPFLDWHASRQSPP
jgi:hypothetical protein